MYSWKTKKNAHTYTDEELYALFPAETLGRDYCMECDPPVRVSNPNPAEAMGTNVIEEEDDDQVDDLP